MKKMFLALFAISMLLVGCTFDNNIKSIKNPKAVNEHGMSEGNIYYKYCDTNNVSTYNYVVYDGNLSKYPVEVRGFYRRMKSVDKSFQPKSTVDIYFDGKFECRANVYGDRRSFDEYKNPNQGNNFLGHHSVIENELLNPNISPNVYDFIDRTKSGEAISDDETDQAFSKVRLVDIDIKEVASEEGYVLEEVTFSLEDANLNVADRNKPNEGRLYINLYYAEKEIANPLTVHKLEQDCPRNKRDVEFYSINYTVNGKKFFPVYIRNNEHQFGDSYSLDSFELSVNGEVIYKSATGLRTGLTGNDYIGHYAFKPDDHVVFEGVYLGRKDDTECKVTVVDHSQDTQYKYNGELIECNALSYVIERK
ncbi:MAG: hypothetical protein Q3996_00650 [Candidatus Saccharibacteria bacterium]|nr:hypothetical protein [Candidatus Saccharibacteria bacterium]